MDTISTNAQAPSGNATPIQVVGGESGRGVSFDYLEQITNEMTSKPKADAKPKAAGTKEKTGELETPIDAKTEKKDLVPEKKADKAEEKKEAKGESKKDEPKAKESKEDGKEAQKPKVEAKKVKAKAGDAELELDENTLIPVKVDGKEEYYTLKELREDRSGKTAWSKRFTELDRQTKEHARKVGEVENTLKDLMNEQDMDIRFYKMAKMTGQDPVAMRKQQLDEQIKFLEKYYTMSDDEKRSFDLEFENKIHKYELGNLKKQQEQQQTQAELDKRVKKLWQDHNVTQEQFVAAEDVIQKALVGQEATKLAKFGIKKAEDVTPENIIKIIELHKMFDPAVESYLGLGFEADDKTEEMLEDFVISAYGQGFKQSDIPDLIKMVFEDKAPKKVVEAKEKEAQEFKTGKKDIQSTAKKDEVLLFEEIL